MDRRAATLQKSRTSDKADNEFCEGRRNVFVNKGDNSFFAGSDVPARNGRISAAEPAQILYVNELTEKTQFYTDFIKI